jgi:hypothetical protein
MSASSGVKLDSQGFIDSSGYGREIRAALVEDARYTQVDYMKKRAVKMSKDYDEFKAFVACAHLKTLK